MRLNDNQLNFLYKLEYLSKSEIVDLLQGWTDIEVILNCKDLNAFYQISGSTKTIDCETCDDLKNLMIRFIEEKIK